MKQFFKNSIVVFFVLAVVLGLVGPMTASAATDPSLGQAWSTYSILAQAGITGTGTISGNVENNGIAAAITGLTTAMVPTGTIYSSDAGNTTGAPPAATTLLNATVQSNASTVYTATIPGLPIEGTPIVGASLDGITRGPGVYDLVGPTITLTTTLTLNGAGTYIFRVPAILTTSGTVVLTGGARACDVFWNVGTGANINGNFVGTILSGTTIAFGAGVTLDGRALGVGPAAAVTLLGNTISGPSCAAPVPPSGGAINNTITVFKQVINDNGGTAVYSDFPLFINTTAVTSGQNVSLAPGTYTVSETNLPGYTTSFAGDCDANGIINHGGLGTHNDICTVINNDIGAPVAIIPPLIHITKIPTPLNLPTGAGSVTYNYSVSNVGIVAMTNVTVSDNKCSPVTYLSGDTNLDSKLGINEIWKYSCTTTLSQTTLNTVTATGRANGLTATDQAIAAVTVGTPLVPPLIDLVKVPTPLFLPAGGGSVKYTYLATNPGTVALGNVSLVDNKCASITSPNGDINGNSLLDTNETWTYTCTMNLTATTTNTATVSGSANGFTVTHASTATVAVAAPALPNTGLADNIKFILVSIITLAGIFAASIFFYFALKKQLV